MGSPSLLPLAKVSHTMKMRPRASHGSTGLSSQYSEPKVGELHVEASLGYMVRLPPKRIKEVKVVAHWVNCLPCMHDPDHKSPKCT